MFLPRIKTALAVAGVAAALPAAATAAHHHRLGAEQPTVDTYTYSGQMDTLTPPAWAGALCIVAKGGDGAGFTDSSYDHTGGGAVISGCLPVTSSDTLLVAPGGAGHMADTRGASDSLGGWGYGGAQGGGGHLGTGADGSTPGFPSGGGGGGTIVQLNGKEIIVAAGGGGQRRGGYDEADGGSGGSAGPVAQSGGTASSGSAPGGAGGAAPGPAGGPDLSPWSDQFASYSWGGGGGGGVNGGGGAVGSQFAGPDVDTGGNGGGAGSSIIDTQDIHGTIEAGTPGQNLDGW